MPCVNVKGDSLAHSAALESSQGTLYPVYATAYKAYKICHFVGLKNKQAGNGPSRHNNSGSKLAKKLQSVKYSFLQYTREEKIFEKFPNFSENFFSNFFGLR